MRPKSNISLSDLRLNAVNKLPAAAHFASYSCPFDGKVLSGSCLNVVHMEETSCQKAVRN
jgi:hypothetical protein